MFNMDVSHTPSKQHHTSTQASVSIQSAEFMSQLPLEWRRTWTCDKCLPQSLQQVQPVCVCAVYVPLLAIRMFKGSYRRDLWFPVNGETSDWSIKHVQVQVQPADNVKHTFVWWKSPD